MQLFSDELQLLAIMLVALTSSLIGTFLVLRKMTMLANALSHTILPGIVLAYLGYHLFTTPQEGIDFSHLLPSDMVLVSAGLVSGIVTTFLAQTIISHVRLAEDASIGMVFTLLFAIGIILVTSFTKSTHVGAELLMGNADALHLDDLKLIFWIFVANTACLVLLWRPYVLTTFDPLYAKMCGLSNTLIGYLLMAQVATTAIGGFRAVGVLLILAFLVTPALIARRLSHSLKSLCVLACLVASVTSVVAIALSRHLLSIYGLACSTAPLIVTLLALLYLALISRTRA